MNYKDPENILVIVCSAMGIGALALLIRYLFIGLGFDSFSANIVFIIAFVIGVIVFIIYLEFIQKLAVRIFSKKQQAIKEPVHIEEVKSIEEPKPDLDSIREEHKQKEQQQRERLLEDAIHYTRTTFAPYATDENIDLLCSYVADYCNGISFNKNIQSITVKELSNGDLFHFGWNIWNQFKPIRNCKQDETAYFLKVVFAKQLKDIEIDTIRKKLTFNEGKFKIELKYSL
ncbi:MAG TPA: hypothetical protein DIT04_02345 [Dysgonomonas sp.]|nr:hypothetical protein [Dysgonomonas sp.]